MNKTELVAAIAEQAEYFKERFRKSFKSIC